MLILPPRPNLAVIQFAVKNFVSLRHGAMMLTADPPKDVASSLTTSEAPPRVSMPDNDTFEFIRGGGPPISLAFAVLPEDLTRSTCSFGAGMRVPTIRSATSE